MKFKILPVTVVFCSLSLAVKVADIAGFNFVQTSRAENTEPEKTAVAENKVDDKAVKSVTDKDKKTADEKKDDEAAEKKDKLPDNVTIERPKQQVMEFTESEKQLLEKLAVRRSELDAREKDLEMKESLLDASSKKVDEKLVQLAKLKADTEVLLKTYNDHEDVKIKSMVKIYESMKPAAAAQIFGEMDMEIMLEIVDKMGEKKASAVLAQMEPKKAKILTENLVRQRSLRPADVKQAVAKTAAVEPPKSVTPPAQAAVTPAALTTPLSAQAAAN